MFKLTFTTKLTSLAATAALVALTSFAAPPTVVAAESAACPATGARIFLTAGGVVTLNGQKVEASKLKDALGSLNPKPTVICYSRDNPGGEPHPASKFVMDAIIAARLPVGMFTDSTFKTQVQLP